MKKSACIILYTLVLLMLIGWLSASNSIIALTSGATVAKGVEFENYPAKDPVYGGIEDMSTVNSFTEIIRLSGWFFTETEHDTSNRSITYLLKNDNNCYALEDKSPAVFRHDVVTAYGDKKMPLNSVGTRIEFSLLNVENGIYDLYVFCRENDVNYGLVKVDYQVIKEDGTLRTYEHKAEPLSEIINVTGDNTVFHALDSVTVDNDTFTVSGWAFSQGKDSNNQKVYIQLENDTRQQYLCTTTKRPDVADAYGSNQYEQCGFTLSCSMDDIKEGTYVLTLLVEVDGNVYASEPHTYQINGTSANEMIQ